MKKYIYEPKGICAYEIEYEIEGDVVKSVAFSGGCPGNHLGLNALVKNQKVDDIIKKLKGIKCGSKSSSCPEQLAIGLELIKNGKIKEVK